MSALGWDEAPQQGVSEPVGPRWALSWLVALLAVLAAVSVYSYPIFHTLAEMFCLIIASSLFIVILPMRRMLDNHYLLFVATGSIFVAMFGIPHILGYAGVALIPGFGNDLPTQAFVVQRALLAGTFLLAPLFLNRRAKLGPAVTAFAVIAVLCLLSILWWRTFPQMFVDGVGPTALKRSLDILLAATFVVSAWLLWRRRAQFDTSVWRALLISLGCFAVSDMFFSVYADPFAWSNLVGHLFQVTGFFFIYRAVLVTALVNPFAILFRELTFRERESERLFAIEARRAERMGLLKELADAGASPLDPAETAQRQLETLSRGLRTHTAIVLLADDRAETLVPLAGVGYTQDYVARHFGPVTTDGPGFAAQVYRTGEAAAIGDVETDPALTDEAREFNRGLGLRSGVSLPLFGGDRVSGVVSLGWDEPHDIDAEELGFLESVASQLAIGLQNARLFTEERVRVARMSTLKDIAELGVFSLDTNEFAQRLAATLPPVLSADRILITVRTGAAGVFLPIGAFGWSSTELAEMTPIPAGSPIIEAYRTGEMTYVQDVHGDDVHDSMRERARRFGSRSVIVAPLLVGGDVIGTLSVSWLEPRILGPDELDFLASVAAEAAVGLQNSRLFEGERDARAHADAELETTRVLLEASRVVSTTLDPTEALKHFADLALKSTGLTRAFVNLVDTRARVLTPVVATDAVDGVVDAPIPFDRLSATSRKAIEGKKVTLMDFERADLPEPDRDIAAANDCRFALFVPLLVAGDIIGHATLDDPGLRHDFTVREIAILEGIAAQVALVVRNAGLFEAVERHAALDRSLAETATTLAATPAGEVAWSEVLELATQALGARSGALALREGHSWRIAAAQDMPHDLVGTIYSDTDAPTLARILRVREMVFVPDVLEVEPIVAQRAAELGYRSFVTTPVLVRGEVVAAFTLTFEHPRAELPDEERYVLSRLAFMIGMSEANARLYRREHEIAETLQEGLLSLPTEVPGIEFAQAYRSATEGSRVGGDFYDVFQLSQQHIGITVGDVSGKGLGAAVVTALVKNTVRAHATERGKTPGRVLSLTDDVVYRATPPETFVTVFFGILDCRDGRLVYANAAHTTGAVIHADGTVGDLGVTGPLLGAFPGVPYAESEAYLDPGDTLFLYTDGVTEARGDGELFGEERLMGLLATLSHRKLRDVVTAVVGDVEHYSGSRLRDDVAILALRRTPLDPQLQGQTKLSF